MGVALVSEPGVMVRHALQDFARLIFGSSSPKGSAFCKISLAPLDVLACHQTTLRVSDFLAAALPPPELNPMHMRVHVTLKEVVQDSLKGTHRFQMAAGTPLKYEVCHSQAPSMRSMYKCCGDGTRCMNIFENDVCSYGEAVELGHS